MRSHARAVFLLHERDGNVWCALAFTSSSNTSEGKLCEIHHWYKHKTTALQKRATRVSETLDVPDVRLFPYSFHVKLSYILLLLLFVKEGLGSVTALRTDQVELDTRFTAAHAALQSIV